ncbi:hypothetical protein JTE90_022188 [Oedothorax gibbosus]|uniref:Cysteine-rich transmembrane CYSTM domain-containing protein n=1 Tax=Oedothorax gibbosus TaxID=931172 RepID=A0AAV6VRE4_9ARAC|nr:hypothetical protein JTE90_022188 [Oedothorax gibbosus]
MAYPAQPAYDQQPSQPCFGYPPNPKQPYYPQPPKPGYPQKPGNQPSMPPIVSEPVGGGSYPEQPPTQTIRRERRVWDEYEINPKCWSLCENLEICCKVCICYFCVYACCCWNPCCCRCFCPCLAVLDPFFHLTKL